MRQLLHTGMTTYIHTAMGFIFRTFFILAGDRVVRITVCGAWLANRVLCYVLCVMCSEPNNTMRAEQHYESDILNKKKPAASTVTLYMLSTVLFYSNLLLVEWYEGLWHAKISDHTRYMWMTDHVFIRRHGCMASDCSGSSCTSTRTSKGGVQGRRVSCQRQHTKS